MTHERTLPFSQSGLLFPLRYYRLPLVSDPLSGVKDTTPCHIIGIREEGSRFLGSSTEVETEVGPLPTPFPRGIRRPPEGVAGTGVEVPDIGPI